MSDQYHPLEQIPCAFRKRVGGGLRGFTTGIHSFAVSSLSRTLVILVLPPKPHHSHGCPTAPKPPIHSVPFKGPEGCSTNPRVDKRRVAKEIQFGHNSVGFWSQLFSDSGKTKGALFGENHF